MHFVNRDGRVLPVPLAAALHPLLIVPLQPTEVGDDGRGLGRQLGREGTGIGLLQNGAVARADAVLVGGSGAHVRDEARPDPFVAAVEVERAVLPAVGIVNDADFARIRSPHGKARSGNPVDHHRVSAEIVIYRTAHSTARGVQLRRRPGQGRAAGFGHHSHPCKLATGSRRGGECKAARTGFVAAVPGPRQGRTARQSTGRGRCVKRASDRNLHCRWDLRRHNRHDTPSSRRANRNPSTSRSTSASVLYRPKLARTVAGTPSRSCNGMVQW